MRETQASAGISREAKVPVGGWQPLDGGLTIRPFELLFPNDELTHALKQNVRAPVGEV